MALDFGSDNLKVVEVVQQGSNFELRDFLVKRLPESLIKRSQFDFNRAAEILRPIFKNRFSAADLSLIISGSRIITKILDLPYVEDEELEKLVFWEVQNIIAEPLEELVIDYEILYPAENRIKVLVVITYKDVLLKEIDLLESLGLQVLKISAAPLLWRNILSTELKDKNLAIIDLGEQETELTVLKEGKLDFRRIFYLGG
ncbi:MAG: pilus assembly protein PilM, partial [Halanaerobacter sp.]